MRIGMLTTCFGGGSLDESFRQAQAAGAEGIEVFCDARSAAALGTPEMARLLEDLSRQTGLAVPSLCLAFVCEKPSLLEPAAEATAALKLIRLAIQTAVQVHAGVLLLPFFGRSTIDLEEEIRRAADAVGRVVDDAEAAGVVLGLETNLNFDRQRYLLECLGLPPCVKIYHDTGNALGRKLDLPSGIRDLGPETVAGVHFKDVRVREGSPPDCDLRLGEGDVDFRAVVQALSAVGYDGWIVLETPPGADPLASARANLQFSRSLLQA